MGEVRFSVAILAGGKSRRMGSDKSQLILQGETLVARVTRRLAVLSDDLILVTNAPEPFASLGARQTGDMLPGGGALSGLHAGLTVARYECALVVGCDMPFLNLDLLRYMASLAPGHAAVVPRWRGELEPLHAFYSRECLPMIEPMLTHGNERITKLYEQVSTRYVEPDEIAHFDPEGLSFFNVNSPEDWERAQELASRAGI